MKKIDPSRIRTCNLLIRSQTRYPLRHEAKVGPHCWAVGQVWMNRIAGKMREITGIPACFLSVVVITCPSHGQGRRFDPGRKHGDHHFVGYSVGSGRCQGHRVLILEISYCPRSIEEDWLVGLGV